MDIAASLLTIKGHNLMSAILRDMTARNHEQRMLLEMAITDALTGIPNRRHLIERGEQELSRIQRTKKQDAARHPLGCIILDIDFFKAVNDTHGHQCGDEVLKELAQRLTLCVRPYDIIGRYGGEEFAAFLTDTTKEQTLMVAERIWQKIRATPFTYKTLSLSITASIGISCLESQDATLDDILKRADIALYQAKKNGRDQISAAL
jgi:diguanylate cyclase (GGDEF)-like protein